MTNQYVRASRARGARDITEHQDIVLRALNLKNLPKNTHVHHRNCDGFDNSYKNLVILSLADHRWLHWQYGTRVLRDYCLGQISLEEMVSWPSDPDRALFLLPLNLPFQMADSSLVPIDLETRRGLYWQYD